MKDIKLRIRSVQSTMQITKAMELVASSKLRKAKERAENSRPYFNLLYDSLCDIAAALGGDVESPYIRERETRKTCYIVVAGDRGLAGGYNNNVFKLVQSDCPDLSTSCFLPIGKKAVEFFQKRNAEIVSRDFTLAEQMNGELSGKAARLLCEGYLRGDFDQVKMVYTNFASMLSQSPILTTVLPLPHPPVQEKPKTRALTLYEPAPPAIFNKIIPDFMAGMVYGGICESLASELAARRNAMDSASKNAGEMIEDLSLKYNRARQGAITQELTEIVAGAEAQ
jgi:F-type H+-transporting ATPase subunit gamma